MKYNKLFLFIVISIQYCWPNEVIISLVALDKSFEAFWRKLPPPIPARSTQEKPPSPPPYGLETKKITSEALQEELARRKREVTAKALTLSDLKNEFANLQKLFEEIKKIDEKKEPEKFKTKLALFNEEYSRFKISKHKEIIGNVSEINEFKDSTVYPLGNMYKFIEYHEKPIETRFEVSKGLEAPISTFLPG